MHDPTTIEAMARAMCLSVWGDELHWTGCRPQATAALSALCTLHPGVCAILSGEAVAVPARGGITAAMEQAGGDVLNYAAVSAMMHEELHPDDAVRRIYRAMLAASPYAQETNNAE